MTRSLKAALDLALMEQRMLDHSVERGGELIYRHTKTGRIPRPPEMQELPKKRKPTNS